MKKITEDNLEEFLETYHDLHDSWIADIKYNIFDSKIELLFEFINDPKRLDPEKKKLRMIFNDVQQCDIREMYSWDYIQEAYLDYILFEEDEYICFANDEKEPMIYIVCEDIDYEEVK